MAHKSARRNRPTFYIDRKTVCMILGATFMWSLFRPSMTFRLMELPPAQLWAHSETESYLALLIGMIVAAIAFTALKPRDSLRVLKIGALCSTAGFVALTCAPALGPDARWMLYATGNALAGFGAAGIWLSTLSELSRLEGAVPSFCMAVSFFCNCLFVMAASLMPVIVAKPLIIASPCFVLGAFFAARRCGEASGRLDRSTRGEKEARPAFPRKDLAYLIISMYLGTIVWGIVFSSTTEAIALTEHIITSLISLFVMGIVIARIATGGDRNIVQASRTVLILLLVTGLFLIQLLQMETVFMATGIITAAVRCLRLLCWILIIESVRDRSTFSQLLGVSFLAIEAVPALLGNVVLPSAITQFTPTLGKAAIDTLVLFMLFALVVAMVLFFNSQAKTMKLAYPAATEHDASQSAKHPAHYKEACRIVAQKATLTPREEEVMNLLAKGFSQKRIAQELYMAEGTVRGYVREVYAKTNVHSKQELIDLVIAEKETFKRNLDDE